MSINTRSVLPMICNSAAPSEMRSESCYQRVLLPYPTTLRLQMPRWIRVSAIRNSPQRATSRPKLPKTPTTSACICCLAVHFPTQLPNAYAHARIQKQRLNPIPSPQSLSGIRMYASIAVLKAAKPTHPSAAALGPALYARIPPVTHPALTLLYRSLFALYPSIQHSVPAYSAPMVAKFLALERDLEPMSRRPRRTCSRTGREVIAWPCGERGVS